ncbi:MAG: amino acid ABC transporter ATP-binding protein, partial [Chloroflexi bacterium]|nr:amino acid ABC transporter ATP-binding protein [Chloroflexota bacterium]
MISFRKVNKWFGSNHVLKDVTFDVAEGEVVVICGPSGSGKSTLIRCINRLEPIGNGELVVDGISVNDRKADINRLRQEIGIVFQSLNLFPHMTAL